MVDLAVQESNFEKQDIVKIMHSIKGNIYTVYSDWIKMSAIAINNSCNFSEKLENEYKIIASKYSADELQRLSDAFGILQVLMEEKYDDYLGSIYMMLEQGSKSTGQFFTPYHIAKLMAEMSADQYQKSEGRVVINEPSCGGGANVIGIIESLHNRGINYQEEVEVVAQDIDWNCVYMCYVQLSLFGVYGKVIHTDTLSGKAPDKTNILYTPMYVMKRGGIV